MLMAGQENTTGKENRSVGGQRIRKQLRPDRSGGDAASGSAVHSVPTRTPPKDVRSCSDAGRRWPSREVGSIT